ncbi:nucleolar protein 58-like isoform X3 [Penaeus japonicus]|uniref:nucleolar protein 58-like isoform X3 n=1 Tax=Penaeus japonicus TaxID=27405 RepID=UPI001C714987|nr:nucleolar protein 58-like isoform X3 [Penaeus japonicus]
MGIRHSKKSVDIQSSPKKNGSTETEVKVKELTEDAPVKAEDAKSGETIEEVAEKTAAPNGDATAEQTQVENEVNKEDNKETEKKEEEKKEEEKKEKKVKKKKSFRSFSFLRREKKAAKVENTNGDVAKEEVRARGTSEVGIRS